MVETIGGGGGYLSKVSVGCVVQSSEVGGDGCCRRMKCLKV